MTTDTGLHFCLAIIPVLPAIKQIVDASETVSCAKKLAVAQRHAIDGTKVVPANRGRASARSAIPTTVANAGE